MDFLLECIGFPPDTDLDALAAHIEHHGEPTAYRGPAGKHLRLPLAAGLELRLDRDVDPEPEHEARHDTNAANSPNPPDDSAHAAHPSTSSLWPYYQTPHRLRVAVTNISAVPDQPFDALLHGRANPPLPTAVDEPDESYPFATYITDARRFPRSIPHGHIVAVSAAGFALDVSLVAPDSPPHSPPASGTAALTASDKSLDARFSYLTGKSAPGGCLDISVRILAVRHIVNPITGVPVELIEADTPGRPTILFASRWQLEHDGLPPPRPGWRIDGCFAFTGRIAGGLPLPAADESGFG